MNGNGPDNGELSRIPGHALLVDRSARIVSASLRFIEWTGYRVADLEGRTLDEFLASTVGSEGTVAFVDHLVAEGVLRRGMLRRRDGAVLPALCAASPAGDGTRSSWQTAVITLHDERAVTPRLEDDQWRAGRLENMALLAGGIGHDFNNMLTAMLGNIALVRSAIGDEHSLQERLAAAEEAGERARDLAYRLLAFARGGDPVRRTLALQDLLRDSAVYALRGTGARCDFEVDPALWPVEADAGQIGQAVQNLVVNAVQAMHGGGTISLVAENVGEPDASAMGLPPGRYVRVTVADTGIGIPAEHRARIFDPFFTTKPQGAGLGLSAVYSIVQKHDGHVTVDSESGVGTRVSFCIPALAATPAQAAPRPAPSARRRILVMDDEPLILEVIGLYLERQGFQPVLAREGGEAVSLYREAFSRGERFDAVVMDLTVPGGMGGAEAIGHLRAIDPEVRAIVASGYSNDPVMAHHHEYGFLAALAKPFRATDLSEALHQLLAV